MCQGANGYARLDWKVSAGTMSIYDPSVVIATGDMLVLSQTLLRMLDKNDSLTRFHR